MADPLEDGFLMDLVCSEMVIKNEIEQGVTLGDVALTYALAMRSAARGSDKPDWKAINMAIIERFGRKGLEQIKKLAHKRLGIVSGTQSASNLKRLNEDQR